MGPRALGRRLAAAAGDDGSLLRLAGLAVPAAVWVLGVVPPPREGLSLAFLAPFTGLLVALVLVDQTTPPEGAAGGRKPLWLAAEIGLCFLVVRAHGTLVRPALIYLLPASRALLLLGPGRGFIVSLFVWIAYAANIALWGWPDRLGEAPNYFSFFLGPYVVAELLTLATIRQAAGRRQVQALYDRLSAAHEELQALHRQARELAVIQERNRLAREIHDSLAHYLTVINVQLEAAQKLGGGQAQFALQHVARARRLAMECLQEVRRSVQSLRATSLEELSLPMALQKLVDEFAEGTGLAIQLYVALPDSLRLPAELAQALYRAAQEGLTNVHRHARATRATVSLSLTDSRVELVVEDDGVGPPADGQPREDQTSGWGLLGMRERIDLLGRTLSFGPRPSAGSRLAVTLPLEDSVWQHQTT